MQFVLNEVQSIKTISLGELQYCLMKREFIREHVKADMSFYFTCAPKTNWTELDFFPGHAS